MCSLDRVRQAFSSVMGLRLEVKRSTPVERELKRDRKPLRSGVFKGGDRSRQSAQLSMAAMNCLTTQWHLHGPATHRPTGVGNRSVESGGDALPDSCPSEVIRSQLMDQGGRRSNPGGKVRVEGWRSHNGKDPRDKKGSGSAVSESESPCQSVGGTHREPFVERRYDADQTSRHT